MSLFRKSDYKKPKETPKKTKIPEEMKTKLATCPFCGAPKWHKLLKKCGKCGKSYTPDKPYSIQRASELNNL